MEVHSHLIRSPPPVYWPNKGKISPPQFTGQIGAISPPPVPLPNKGIICLPPVYWPKNGIISPPAAF